MASVTYEHVTKRWGDVTGIATGSVPYKIYDYHLKSTAGHWDSGLGVWTNDAANSPCIDAGDPASAWTNEPSPNGGQINMGAYGNTEEASKSTRTADSSASTISWARPSSAPRTRSTWATA